MLFVFLVWGVRGLVAPETSGSNSAPVYHHKLNLSPHYPRKKKGSFLHKYKESHTPKSIKDP